MRIRATAFLIRFAAQQVQRNTPVNAIQVISGTARNASIRVTTILAKVLKIPSAFRPQRQTSHAPAPMQARDSSGIAKQKPVKTRVIRIFAKMMKIRMETA